MVAVAIILLQLAALPAGVVPSTRAALFIAERRTELAVAGIGVLAAVAIAALLV